MRVHGEAAQGTFNRIIEGEVIEEQEGIEEIRFVRRDGTTQQNVCTLDYVLGFDGLGNGS